MSASQSSVAQKVTRQAASHNRNGDVTQKLPRTAATPVGNGGPKQRAPETVASQTKDGAAQKPKKKLAQTAIIISAFACCGNTYFKEKCKHHGYNVVDLDSENYGWKKDDQGNFILENKERVRSETWYTAYLDDIEDKARMPGNNKTIILVSTHPETRKGLPKRGLKFSVVHPELGLKKEWLDRMNKRKCSSEMVETFTKMWATFVGDCAKTTLAEGYKCHTLGSGQYLSDIAHNIVDGFPKPSTV